LKELYAVVDRAKAGLAAPVIITRQTPRKSDAAFRFMAVLLVGLSNLGPWVELFRGRLASLRKTPSENRESRYLLLRLQNRFQTDPWRPILRPGPMPTPAVRATGEHWLAKQRLGLPRPRLFQLHHVHLTATFSAPTPSCVRLANDPEPVGFHGDLSPLVGAGYALGNLYPTPELVVNFSPHWAWCPWPVANGSDHAPGRVGSPQASYQ